MNLTSSNNPFSIETKEKPYKLNKIEAYTDRHNYYKTSKFENYSERKFLIDEKKTSKILTYIEPFNYSKMIKNHSKNKFYSQTKIPTIKIGKLKGRDNEGLINENNYTSPLTYRQKIESIKQIVRNCIF